MTKRTPTIPPEGHSDPALLVKFDRALGVLRNLVAAAKAVGPIDDCTVVPQIYDVEKMQEGPLKTFYEKCIDLDNQASTMDALTVYLEDHGCEDKDFCFRSRVGPTFHGAAAMRALYVALVSISPSVFRPGNQEWFREARRLEQALEKARAFFSDCAERER